MSHKFLFRVLLLAGLLSTYTYGYTQDTVKIMTYNILNYNGADPRDTCFRKTLKAADPDILVIQEVLSQGGVDNFLANCLNYWSPGVYAKGTFINGPDTDNAIFFKASKFSFLINAVIPTALRDINVFQVRHTATQKDLFLISVHLKASAGSAEEQQRLAEVNNLRGFTNSLPAGSDFMVMGDFNIYGSTEPAYNKLKEVQSGNEGHFIDYVNMPGSWNNATYKAYHTQSPRVRQFGGGSNGGMDDRFDMILYSKAVSEPGGITYVPNSMTPYGNDGNHFNDSINKRPNTAVPDSIADALHYAADHIPVIAKFTFQVSSGINPVAGQIPGNFKLQQNYPNPFNPSTKIRFDLPSGGYVQLRVYDVRGREVAQLVNERLTSGVYEIPFNAASLPGGAYFYRLNTEGVTLTKKMLLVK